MEKIFTIILPRKLSIINPSVRLLVISFILFIQGSFGEDILSSRFTLAFFSNNHLF